MTTAAAKAPGARPAYQLTVRRTWDGKVAVSIAGDTFPLFRAASPEEMERLLTDLIAQTRGLPPVGGKRAA